jgi:DNA (cytosine-5)-methyltransferase 1
MNYYNENNPKAAAWLRELMMAGLIPAGEVDERSITDVKPHELTRFIQCHFFAGIGGWPYALQLAGWPKDKAVWTGSCPCQPFSVAGKTETVGDERHLWPSFYRLIAECRPAICFGEQVSGPPGYEWLSGIRVDLERAGYAVGASDLCAASVSAPHPRPRLYWVGDTNWRGLRTRSEQQVRISKPSGESILRLGDTERPERGSVNSARGDDRRDLLPQREEGSGRSGGASKDGQRMVYTNGTGPQSGQQAAEANRHRSSAEPASSDGFWSDWELCYFTDGKTRRIESGTKPLATGVPARMVRLCGYGNAIVPKVAAEFIQAYCETLI